MDFGDDLREGPLRVSPRLEVMMNGSTKVNMQRAELSAAVRFDQETLDAENLQLRGDAAAPKKPAELTKAEKKTVGADLPDGYFATFLEIRKDIDAAELREGLALLASRHVKSNTAGAPDLKPTSVVQKGSMIAADLPAKVLDEIRRNDDGAWSFVNFAELGETITFSPPIVSASGVRQPTLTARQKKAESNRHHYGEEVLVGIIDVQGFDFAHPDFLNDDGETRWERIWDQRGGPRPSPSDRDERYAGLDYGSEIMKEHMDGALRASPERHVSATLLEPQSQMTPASHGTHVASIAAGNRGVARRAKLAGVLIALDPDDRDRRSSLYDSTRIAHAVEYLIGVGSELGLPVSINISLGTNGHAHDASSTLSRWVDHALTGKGRSVCVAAGNAGQVEPRGRDDFGFVMGRVHASGRIAGVGLTTELKWNVVGNQLVDVSENEMEIWYAGRDRLGVEVKPPAGAWIGPFEAGQHLRNFKLPDLTMLSIYNETYHPANGANRIAIYLSPFFATDSSNQTRVVGVPAGEWRVRITGREIRDGTYHAWIERDDPRRIGAIGEQEAWSFPSFFSTGSYVGGSTVSSLACGQRVISVANLTADESEVNVTSSQGPTRDGRAKPDLGAVGTNVIAAEGFRSGGWVSMDGTSMASPLVAGVVALMLGIDCELTAAQIGAILQRTARPLPGDDYQWKSCAGFGAINPEAALKETVDYLARRTR